MAVNFSLTALTGINSASTGLGVISNNISNAQTTGFKSSRAEFADLFYGAQSTPGTGSRTQAVTQSFSQGAINDTGNSLDLAINGEGMFIMSDISGRYDAVYTRNGSFKLDKEGFITDQTGNKLQGFSKDNVLSTPSTSIFKTILEPMNIGTLNKIPKATSQITFDLNLNGQDQVTYNLTSNGGKQSASGVPFTANNLQDMSYNGAPNYSTTKEVIDSVGGRHRMTVNYYKVAVNAPGTYPSGSVSSGNSVTYTQETTDWYAQYIMEDYDETTGQWYKAASTQESAINGTNNQNAMASIIGAAGGIAAGGVAANAASTFGVPTTAADAGESAYSLALALGANSTQANAAKTAASAAFAGATPALSAFNAAFGTAGTLATSAVITAAQGTDNTSVYTAYSAAPWGAESGRLSTLYNTVTPAIVFPAATNASLATLAAQQAQAAAITMGLNATQAAQAATAAQSAIIANGGVGAAAWQAGFNAAFGSSGVVTSIPDASVQAYRFDSTGKLLDFNNQGNFAQISGNTTSQAKVTAPLSWYFDVPNSNGTVGVTESMTLNADISNLTQYAGAYNIRGVTQDGYAAGDLVGVQINKDGSIEAQYSNGRSDTVAKLALATFSDKQSMQKLGNQMWAETSASGPRQLGNPQASGFGSVQSGALEYSNVDVTSELVNMIFMQKMYQASAQVISTDKTLTQTILQL
jgi:flagellar hook-basal body protein